jgi:outer membrane murein-binding lipoprotein Lpp
LQEAPYLALFDGVAGIWHETGQTTRLREILFGIVATIIMCGMSLQAQTQKSQSPDMQALKDRLQRLEQEMQELKGEIDAAQQGQG